MIISANWKMNKNVRETRLFFEEFLEISNVKNHRIIIAPPYVSLETAVNLTKEYENVEIFAQNCHQCESGAFTGEISANMLESMGVKGVILGHSERRKLGETNEIIKQKIRTAFENNLEVILCVGETLQEHKSGNTQKIIEKQITSCVKSSNQIEKIIVAYEPIWAIGSGNIEDPKNIESIAKFIKTVLGNLNCKKSKTLYGGSVNAENCQRLSDIQLDGVLLGAASLSAENLKKILDFFEK